MNNEPSGAAATLLMIAFFGYGIVQIIAGWAGIDHNFGWGWALGAVVAAFFLRFTIPIVIGCFICAHDIWGWNWFFALLFAAPGLAFMIPSVLASVFSAVSPKR
jgi:hypothetical protein